MTKKDFDTLEWCDYLSCTSIVVDLTHTFTRAMPVHACDEKATIEQIRNITEHSYNDWRLSSGMHVGTHIDGPGHLTESTALLSDVPVSTFLGNGYLIDARNKPIDLSLLKDMPNQDGLIVLILTGFDKKMGTDEYFNDYPIVQSDLAYELVRRKVKMVGIDFFSPDHYPFPVHKILLDSSIYIIENLTNLDTLVNKNFFVIALPLKTATDSSLTRVIAIVDQKCIDDL